VRRLERDLPELLTFFDFPLPLWRKRTDSTSNGCRLYLQPAQYGYGLYLEPAQ
jgi:hypothetical protein